MIKRIKATPKKTKKTGKIAEKRYTPKTKASRLNPLNIKLGKPISNGIKEAKAKNNDMRENLFSRITPILKNIYETPIAMAIQIQREPGKINWEKPDKKMNGKYNAINIPDSKYALSMPGQSFIILEVNNAI